MTNKTVTFKLDAGEVDALDNEADAENKNRSEYLREIIRHRDQNVEQQLEKQGLTKEHKAELEQKIKSLQLEKEDLKAELRAAEDRTATLHNTLTNSIQESVRNSMVIMREEYAERLEELHAENKQLRADNEDLQQQLRDVANHINDKEFLTKAHLERHHDTVQEEVRANRDTIFQQYQRAADNMETEREEIIDEVQRSRSPLTKLLDWIGGIGS